MSDKFDDAFIWCCMAAFMCLWSVLFGLPWLSMLLIWVLLVPIIVIVVYLGAEESEKKVKLR